MPDFARQELVGWTSPYLLHPSPCNGARFLHVLRRIVPIEWTRSITHGQRQCRQYHFNEIPLHGFILFQAMARNKELPENIFVRQ